MEQASVCRDQRFVCEERQAEQHTEVDCAQVNLNKQELNRILKMSEITCRNRIINILSISHTHTQYLC